jgi:cysteine desulfurase / selenocysteine lyase
VPSTSFAFNMVAQALRARGVTEVLTLEREFPSTTLPLLHHGLTLRVVRERPDGTYPLEDVEAALGPSTGAIAVSLVQYASGFRVDVDGLATLARARGLPLCLNAAQAVGHVPVRAQAWDASFVAGPSHKWLAAGYGQAFLWLREDWLAEPSPLAGWLSVEPVDLWHPFTAGATRRDDARGATVTGARFRADASRLEVGGTAFLLPYALDAALALHEGLTVEATLRHVQQLQALLRTGLARRGFVPTAPEGPTTSAGLCVVRVEGPPDDAVRALFREDVATTARGGGLRLSTHVYNDESDVDRLLWAVDRLGLRPAADGGGP